MIDLIKMAELIKARREIEAVICNLQEAILKKDLAEFKLALSNLKLEMIDIYNNRLHEMCNCVQGDTLYVLYDDGANISEKCICCQQECSDSSLTHCDPTSKDFSGDSLDIREFLKEMSYDEVITLIEDAIIELAKGISQISSVYLIWYVRNKLTEQIDKTRKRKKVKKIEKNTNA